MVRPYHIPLTNFRYFWKGWRNSTAMLIFTQRIVNVPWLVISISYLHKLWRVILVSHYIIICLLSCNTRINRFTFSSHYSIYALFWIALIVLSTWHRVTLASKEHSQQCFLVKTYIPAEFFHNLFKFNDFFNFIFLNNLSRCFIVGRLLDIFWS
jgi:hypothetical protein